jgi:DNA-binding NtrC family response regulator
MRNIAENINTDSLTTFNDQVLDERIKKIFIIEDNEMHSMMMDYMLSKDNSLNIFRFKTGEECIKKLNLNPDIIILDYELPGINGMETYAQIKRINPKIPVVVISENRNMNLADQFKKEGVYEYIFKEPNSFYKLNAVVDSLLSLLAQKERTSGVRLTAFIVGGFIIIVALSSLISYLLLRH